MLRLFTLLFSLFLILSVAFSQEATAIHEIKKGSEPNAYIVKTIITGIVGVDIARATYMIDDAHTYSKSTGSELFSSRNKDYIKFYVMAVPESGTIIIELGLTLANEGQYSFPVEFQYSRNDEKKTIQFPEIVFAGSEMLAIAEEPVKKETVLETETIMVPSSPLVVKQPETILPLEKEEVVIPVVKEAVVEKEIVVETVVEDVVEEEIVIEKPTIKEELADTRVKYTIQLLSLSKFSQARFDAYCEKHSLLDEEVSIRVVNGITKVVYGKANSLKEAKKLIDRLKLLNNIDGAFAVPL